MTGPSIQQRRGALATGLRAAVLLLFALSLIFVIITNRFTPERAAPRPCLADGDDGYLTLVKGFCLWYRDRGPHSDRPTVILLHGGPDFPTAVYADAFAFLEREYRVVAYDQRGTGRSQIREALSSYTMSHLVQELELLRRDVIKSDSVILIGHMIGGTLALQYALSYPAYVDRLVLISPLPPDGERMTSVMDPFRTTVTELVRSGLPPADPQEADLWNAQAVVRSLHRGFHRTALASEIQYAGGSFGVSRALMASLAAGRRNATAELRTLPVPVLVFGGTLTEPAWMPAYRRTLKEHLPRSSLFTFGSSGDWPFFEEPQIFRKSVEAFLRGENSL